MVAGPLAVSGMAPTGVAPRARASGLAVASPEALRIDRELAALARARGPARRVLVALAARLVATRGWERLGFVRLADYARERLGLMARTVQDLAHVDDALSQLPALGAALMDGRLIWTQVRLLARVAEPGDVGAWLTFAERRTARALAIEVRRVDRGTLAQLAKSPAPETDEDGAAVEVRERVALRCSVSALSKWNTVRHRAWRMAGEVVPKWQCLELVAAEVLSGIGLTEGVEDPGDSMAIAERYPPRAANGCAAHGRRKGTEGPAGGRRAGWSCVPSEFAALPPELAKLVRGLESLDAFALDGRLRKILAFEQSLEVRVAPLLRAVSEGRLYRGLGFGSLAEYVPERLGMSPRRARSLVRIERAAERCPSLHEAWREARVSWVQAEALSGLVPEVSSAVAAAWVEHAQRVPVRRLQDEVDAARCGAAPMEPPPAGSAERQTGAQPTQGGGAPETVCLGVWCPRDVALLFRAVLCSMRKHLERQMGPTPSEGEAFEAMLDHALNAWSVPGRRPREPHHALRLASPARSTRRSRPLHRLGARRASLRARPPRIGASAMLRTWHSREPLMKARTRISSDAS